MAGTVMTAMGSVSTEELGVTSMHDHLLSAMPGWQFDASYVYDKEAVLKKCVEEVNAAKALGLTSMVEASTMDITRDPELYRAVQKETGVNIICTTGLYTEADGQFVYWKYLMGVKGYDHAVKSLADSYIKDITVGMEDTDVKCGLVKVAVGPATITKVEEVAIHAAVLAQKETGVPIISHTGHPTMGATLADMLLEKGADPKKTLIGHMCDTDDIDTIETVLKKGVWVGLDRFGLSMIFDDEKKVTTLCKLVKMGYVDQIVVGHDYTVYNHAQSLMPDIDMPNFNLCGLFKTFIPKFKENGLTDEEINKIMVENPKRIFEGV